VGLLSTVIGYGVANVVVAAAGLIAQSVVARRGAWQDAVEPPPDQDNGFVPGWPGCLPPCPDSETRSMPDAERLAIGARRLEASDE
jgi:hypothetical protein